MLPQPFEQMPRTWKHLVSENNGSLELVRGLTEDTVRMRNTPHTKVLLRLNTLSPLGGAVWGGYETIRAWRLAGKMSLGVGPEDL